MCCQDSIALQCGAHLIEDGGKRPSNGAERSLHPVALDGSEQAARVVLAMVDLPMISG